MDQRQRLTTSLASLKFDNSIPARTRQRRHAHMIDESVHRNNYSYQTTIWVSNNVTRVYHCCARTRCNNVKYFHRTYLPIVFWISITAKNNVEQFSKSVNQCIAWCFRWLKILSNRSSQTIEMGLLITVRLNKFVHFNTV